MESSKISIHNEVTELSKILSNASASYLKNNLRYSHIACKRKWHYHEFLFT